MANSPAHSVIDVGSVIADTYTIEALIGRGGMGAVYLASHKRLPGKQVAIKVLHTDAEDAEVLIRFRREAEIASRLGHPNIVGVSDFNVTGDGTPYLVLEYLIGETLAQRLQAGPIPIEQAMSITRQVGSALAAAHRANIVHRDLKPQNIFLVRTEVDGHAIEVAKVLDFGISKIRGSETVKTQDNSLLGTPQYMAPEQATGQHKLVDARTDVFALGAIVYEMLTGHPAFNGASIPEVVFKVVYEQPLALATEAPSTPASVVGAVEQAMSKTAADRFPTMDTFVEALTGQALSQFKVPTVPPPDVGFAAGSRISRGGAAKAGGDDAFAHTVGSGDHGPAVVPASVKPSIGVDATIASSSQNGTVPPVPVPVSVPTPVAVAVPASNKPMTMMIALAVVCIAAAAIAIVFATRRGGDPEKHVVIDAGVPIAVGVVTPDAAIAPPIDASIAPPIAPIDAPVIAIAKPDAAVAVAARIDAGAKATEPEDADSAQKLSAADKALAAGDHGTADQFANQVFAAEGRSAEQGAHASAVRAMSKCLQFDEEQARNNMRSLSGKWRAKALKFCHDHGQLSADN